jgi:hypothetical protein
LANFAELCGPSYTRPIGQTQIQTERTVNFRLERLTGSSTKNQFVMLRQPGLGLFANTALNARVRGALTTNGRTFTVVGSHFLELFANGTFTDYTTSSGVNVPDDGRKVWFDANPQQVMAVGGSAGFIFTLATNVLVQITDVNFPVLPEACSFLGGYFIVSIRYSQQFQISALNDGTAWDALDISSAESRPDHILNHISTREEVWFFGSTTIQPYYNSGDADFPLAPNLSAVIPSGVQAAQSVCNIGGILFWMKIDNAGSGTFCRSNGYTEVVISNHAVESVWSTYKSLDKTYCWPYQENGHACVRVNFPDIDGLSIGTSATWEYDMSTNQWTETPSWNQAQAKEEAHRGYCSFAAFGKTLVGDRENGKIYELSVKYLDDNGALIRRVRRCPHIYKEGKLISYHSLLLDGNKGIGLNVASDQPYYNPEAKLLISDDGGKTFQPFTPITFGPMGQYKYVPEAIGLGSGRDRVFELVFDAPVDWAISGASLELTVHKV